MNAIVQDSTSSSFLEQSYRVVQAALWPEIGISTEEESYARLKGASGISLTGKGVIFGTGGIFETNTYFNLFNLGKWFTICGKMPWYLKLSGRGDFHLTITAVQSGRSSEKIFCDPVTLLESGSIISLDLSGIDAGSTALYFSLVALSEGELLDFSWATSSAPKRTPNLILAVTTFRREAEVNSTIARFERFMEKSELWPNVKMVVVDNGRTIECISSEAVTVIPNENFGGSGGFARGLLHARQESATHCLFMDDDASMHMESIARVWWFLAYANDPRTAVAGAMIDADYRWKIWENGAIFELGCKPQFSGLDTRDSNQLMEMELQSIGRTPNDFYGGWWLFAFPIKFAQHMPFPFFVRGDDVSFSLANDFAITTLSGVASVQQNFTDKASPLTWYLDLRSHLAHHLSLASKHTSWTKIMSMIFMFYLRNVLRFHYESIAAVNLAIEDVIKGPRFFSEHADLVNRRTHLKKCTVSESWRPLEQPQKPRLGRCQRWQRAILLITLNGHLLPFSNWLGTDLVVTAEHRENFREVYGARQITYLDSRKRNSYTVTRNFRSFWLETRKLMANCFEFFRKYENLKMEWEDRYADLTSEEFWHCKLDFVNESSQ